MQSFANIGEYFSSAVPGLCRYWLEKSDGRQAPARSDLDPLEMPKQSLPYTMLVDIDQKTLRVRYRVVGTAISRLFSMDFTGFYLNDILMPGDYRQAAEALYRHVALTEEPVVGHYGYP